MMAPEHDQDGSTTCTVTAIRFGMPSRALYHRRFRFDTAALPDEYHTISKGTAIRMLLLMDEDKQETSRRRAQKIAQTIANMHHCEARG